MPPVIETGSASGEAPLLNELQSTIKTRWVAFDNQLPTGKSLNEDYRSIKSAYDGIMSHLASVKTDTELTQNEEIKGKLDEFLGKLTQYLQSDTRRRELDGILADTNTQFKALRDKIYGQQQVAQAVQAENGKLKGEVAANKSASQPESLPTTAQAAAAVVGGTGIVATIESTGKNAEEAAKKVMKPLEKIKKWSSDIGDAWDAGWELVKKGDISKGIGLFFAVLFGGNLKDALAKYTGKADEIAATDTPENPSQSDVINVNEIKEKEKKEYQITEAVKLLVNINTDDSVGGSQKTQMQKFLRDGEFTKLPLSAIGPMFVSSGYKLTDALKKTLAPAMQNSGVTAANVELALKCMFAQDGLIAKQLQEIYRRAQEKNGQTATVGQCILESYSSLGIFMKLADRQPGIDDVDIGINYNHQTGEITGGAKEIIGDRLSAKSIVYITHTNKGDIVPKSSKDLKLNGEKTLDEKSSQEIRDFTDFVVGIRNNYQFIFGAQISDPNIASLIKNNLENISYSNGLKMYAILDGNSDPSKMLEAQRFALLMFLGNIGDNTQGTSQFNTYMIEQAGWHALGKANDLPESFSQYAELFLRKTWNLAKGAADKTFDGWVGVARENKILATAMFMAFVFSLRWTRTTGIESLIPKIK